MKHHISLASLCKKCVKNNYHSTVIFPVPAPHFCKATTPLWTFPNVTPRCLRSALDPTQGHSPLQWASQPNHLQRGRWDPTKMHLVTSSPSSHASWGADESWWHWVVCPVGTGSLRSYLLPLHRNPKKLHEVIERYDLSKHQHVFSFFFFSLHEPQGNLKSKLKLQKQKVFRH